MIYMLESHTNINCFVDVWSLKEKIKALQNEKTPTSICGILG